MTINVHIGDGVSLDMGTQSFMQYVADDTPASLDISLLGILRTFAAATPAFMDDLSEFPGLLVMRTGGFDLEVRGTLAGDSESDPVPFTAFTVDSFELNDNTADNARIVSMTLPGLDLLEMVNLVFADPGSTAGLVGDFAALLASDVLSIADGSEGNVINGTSGADTLSGNYGNDTLAGLAGSDELYGGQNGDHLDGGAGDDVVHAGGGRDWLSGGAGHDFLVGSNGPDTFYFRLPVFAASSDIIHDFTPGSDVIQFDNMPLVIGAAVESSEFRSAKNISGQGGANTPDQHFLYDKDSGRLYYDADGSLTASKPVLVAALSGNPVLTAADLDLVS